MDRTISRFAAKKILLPTWDQLRAPGKIPAEITKNLESVDPNTADPINLFRIHWYNQPEGRNIQDFPNYVELPSELTGVRARILVLTGATFPMIGAHKVLAAYGCLAPRLVTGQFDPTMNRAIWPSTGNYCRGGIAVSRIMDCHGVAILPEGMSEERFQWLNDWCLNPEEDIIRTYGCESNVKEIYDKCNELDKDPQNIIFNQFCEFGNTLIHYYCTGQAIESVFQKEQEASDGELNLFAFTSATGSAGTIAAGDYLKEVYGSKIVAVEALECPTLLYNGFGDHNIQGIGDKHVPLIHNTMNTDLVAGISDAATDNLFLLFHHPEGKSYLKNHRGVTPEVFKLFQWFGLSSFCNILAAIKTAKYYDLDDSQVLVTVATDSSQMYSSEKERAIEKYHDGSFSEIKAAEIFGQYLLGENTAHLKELNHRDREAIFNLGYFTWVEQQGIGMDDFLRRKEPVFWKELRKFIPTWNELIEEFNEKVKTQM